jgi:hypothetical protein
VTQLLNKHVSMGSKRRRRVSKSSKGSRGLEENSFENLKETKDAATGHEASSPLLLREPAGFDFSFAYK